MVSENEIYSSKPCFNNAALSATRPEPTTREPPEPSSDVTEKDSSLEDAKERAFNQLIMFQAENPINKTVRVKTSKQLYPQSYSESYSYNEASSPVGSSSKTPSKVNSVDPHGFDDLPDLEVQTLISNEPRSSQHFPIKHFNSSLSRIPSRKPSSHKDTNEHTQDCGKDAQGPQIDTTVNSNHDFPPLVAKVGQVGFTYSSCTIPPKQGTFKWKVRNDITAAIFNFERPKPMRGRGLDIQRRVVFTQGVSVPNFVSLHRPGHAYLKKKARLNRKHYG